MAILNERYAAAILHLSLEQGKLPLHMEQAVLIQNTLQIGQTEAFLLHPNIPDREKHAFFETLFSGKIDDVWMGFLFLAVDKSREALILPAIEAYITMGNRHLGKISATVVSALPLKTQQKAALQELLSQKMQKQVELTAKVDASVIGGLYIHMEGRLMDKTVRTGIKNMTEAVKRGV